MYFNNINFIYNSLFCCNHACYCVCMVFVTSASRYVRQRHVLKVVLDVHPRSDSTQFHGFGAGSSDCLLRMGELIALLHWCSCCRVTVRAVFLPRSAVLLRYISWSYHLLMIPDLCPLSYFEYKLYNIAGMMCSFLINKKNIKQMFVF